MTLMLAAVPSVVVASSLMAPPALLPVPKTSSWVPPVRVMLGAFRVRSPEAPVESAARILARLASVEATWRVDSTTSSRVMDLVASISSDAPPVNWSKAEPVSLSISTVAGSTRMLPALPSLAPARNWPPARVTWFWALSSMAPPLPLAPALASRVAPAWKAVLLPARTRMVPPSEAAPLPRADRLAPAARVRSLPAVTLMSPPRTPAPPGAARVPEMATSWSATIWIWPAFTTTLVADSSPLALTTSLKSGAEPMNRAPLYKAPPTLMVPAESWIPSIALI